MAYDYELRNEPILRKSIEQVGKYIFDYINIWDKRLSCEEVKNQAIFDIDRCKWQTQIDLLQREMDELTEKMNKNISPYHWIIIKGVDIVVDG